MKLLFDVLAKNPSIVSLDLTGNIADLSELRLLAQLMSTNNTILSLNLSLLPIRNCPENLQPLAPIIKNGFLKELTLQGCGLGAQGLQTLLSMANKTSLQHLDLTYNLFNTEAIQFLAHFIARNTHLLGIYCTNCPEQAGLNLLRTAVTTNTILKELTFKMPDDSERRRTYQDIQGILTLRNINVPNPDQTTSEASLLVVVRPAETLSAAAFPTLNTPADPEIKVANEEQLMRTGDAVLLMKRMIDERERQNARTTRQINLDQQIVTNYNAEVTGQAIVDCLPCTIL